MREYKFRAYDLQGEQMRYDITGFEFFNDGEMSGIFIDGDFYDKKEIALMQYTGIKDENGKEIYEGDIIEFSYDMFVGDFDTFVAKGKIVFEEGAFYVEVFENERTTEDEAYLLYSINLDTIEVIGNIYENKELLNETNR